MAQEELAELEQRISEARSLLLSRAGIQELGLEEESERELNDTFYGLAMSLTEIGSLARALAAKAERAP